MFWGLGRRVVEVRGQGPKLLGKSFGAYGTTFCWEQSVI